MRCQNGHQNPEDARFCQDCGVRIMSPEEQAQEAQGVPQKDAPKSELYNLTSLGDEFKKSGAGSLWAKFTGLKPAIQGGAIAAVAAIVLAIGIGVSQHSSGSSGTDVTDTSSSTSVTDNTPQDASSPVPLTPQERCATAVNDLLAQVPDALREGYSSGMKTNSLSTEYGYQSPEFQTFISAQAQLISSIATNGHPDEQLAAVRPAVTQGCAEAR